MRLKKIIIILFVALFGGVSPIFSQKISVEFDNLSVKQAIEILQVKYNYSFSMNTKDIDLNKRINFKVNNTDIKLILKKIFNEKQYKCIVKESIITIIKKQEKKTKKIKGKVIDATGEAVIGASVFVKGTSNGVTSDINGEFEIIIESGEFLSISSIGFVTKVITDLDEPFVKVQLVAADIDLDEVVVTALGIKRKEKALSYNVQKVSNESFVKNKDANFVNALSGKVAGVNINSSSSGVGGASKVVMRGTKSIQQSSNALYVIDGVPLFNFGGGGGTEFGSAGATEAIADINPEDIESVSVLTGAAAAALYGSNGANGAIVITTKKGKKGVTSLNVSSSTEVMRAFVTPEFQNSYGTGDLVNNTTETDRSWGKKLNESNLMGYNPVNDFLKTAVVYTNNVAYSTGKENSQTYVSAGAVNSKGIILNNQYNRYNFTFRNTSKSLNDKLKLDIGGSYIQQDDRNMINQGIYSNPLVAAYLFPRGDDWNDIKMYERYDITRKIYTQYWPQKIDEFVGQNPYWAAYRNTRENKKSRYMANIGLSYDVNDWLNFSARARIDNSITNGETKLYSTSHKTITRGSDNGLYGTNKTETNQTYADILLNINKNINDKITFNANIGASYSDMKYDQLMITGPILNNGLPNVFNVFQLDDVTTKRSQSGWHDQTQSVFASAELGYSNAYYLTLTARNDWASQLAGLHSNVKSFFYPSIGTSFVLSEIFKLPEQIQYSKLRASFASVGTPFRRFLANPTYGFSSSSKAWATQTTYPMYNLKPEKTESIEIGLTTKFLNHFSFDATYYKTKTFNQTFNPQISPSAGYSTLYLQTGNVQNEGVELALGYKMSIRDFSWNSNFTLSTNRNKILELVDNYYHPQTGMTITKDRLVVGGLGYAKFILKKGGSLGDLYSTADLLRDDNGDIVVNENGNVEIKNNVDDIFLGSVLPKANLGWRNDFKYKRFSVGFLLSARLGGVVYSETQAILDRYGVSKSSEIARDNGGIVLNNGDIVNAQKWYETIGQGIPQFYTYSATNVRLQEASIGYEIPKKSFFNVADVSLSLVGRNLLMIYCKAPFDPESVATTNNYYQGIDKFMMPSLSSIGFNARIKF